MRIAAMVAVALFLFTGCDDDDKKKTKSEWILESTDATGGGQVFVNRTDATKKKLVGEFFSDLTLTSDIDWYLEGGVFIGNDTALTTLTIQPGTTIYGLGGTPLYVFVID